MPDPKKFKPISDFYKNKKQDIQLSKKDIELNRLLKEQNNLNEDKKNIYQKGYVNNPKSITYKKQKKELENKQTYVSQDNRSEELRKYDEDKGNAKENKKKLLKIADVTTDVMQLGNFVPHPIGQVIGKAGNILGSTVDGYQAYNDFSEGNYVSGGINAASAILPKYLDTKLFGRNSKYSPISKDLNNLFGDFGRTKYLNVLNQVKNQSSQQLNTNRALLGTLGLETTYDTQYALGGQLKNNMKNNQLTRFDTEGQEHENSKLGGIPQGIGSDGKMNTVETGETKMKNYVYSNRISIDENMTKEMNLPSYIKGKTFANASKAIDNKFKDRNDNHSLETKKVFLERLKEAQETLKQQEQQRAEQLVQSMQSNQQEVPDMMNGEIPEGMEEFTEQPKQFWGGGELGAATGALQLGNLSQGIGASPNKNATALNGALTGAKAGMAFGPWGAGIGAAIGLGAGIMGGNKAQNEQANFAKKQALMFNKGVSGDEFAYGGYVKQFGGGGNTDEEDPTNPLFKPTNTIPQVGAGKPSSFLGYSIKPKNVLPKPPLADDLVKPITKEEIQAYQLSKGIAKPGVKGYGNFGPKTTAQFDLDKKNWTPETPDTSMLKSPEQPFVEPTGVRQAMEDYYNTNKTEDTEKTPTDFKSIANQALRLSPVLSNFSQLKGLKRPNPVNYQPLRNTYQYDPVDETRQEKIMSEEGNKQLSAIAQSGASQGALRNAITSVGLNTTKARNEAAINASEINRAQRLGFQQSQLGVNQYNNQLKNKAIDETRMDQGNYDTQKSKFIGQIGSDLGEIGKEQVYRDKVGQLFGYDENGKYLVGPKGEKIRVSENTQTTTTGYKPNKFGGYITRKKY